METFADGEMADALIVQLQTEAMTHRRLLTVVSPIVSGGLVPMHVDGETDVVRQLRDVRQSIGTRNCDPAGTPSTTSCSTAARRSLWRLGETGAVFLKERPSTGHVFKDPLDPGDDPLSVGDLRTRLGVSGVLGEISDGREERVVHGGGYAGNRH
jgi:hypothetical protein